MPCCSDFPSTLGGFPHSEIPGSKLIRSSPRLIAAYHVLHRLCMPRHPPIALKTLDRSHCQCSSAPKGKRHQHKKTSFSRSVRGAAVKQAHHLAGIERPHRQTTLVNTRSFRASMAASLSRSRSDSGVRTNLLFTMSYRTGGKPKPSTNLFLPVNDCPLDTSLWWSQTGSNRRPHACKARALPAELWPLIILSRGTGGPGRT